MAWEWVAPSATALSGMTGIYFTYRISLKQQKTQLELLGQQLNAERKQSALQLKRATYARCLAKLSEAHLQASFFIANESPTHQPANKAAEAAKLRNRLGLTSESISAPELRSLLAELQLVASTSIVSLAKACIDTIISIGVTLEERNVEIATNHLSELGALMLADINTDAVG